MVSVAWWERYGGGGMVEVGWWRWDGGSDMLTVVWWGWLAWLRISPRSQTHDVHRRESADCGERDRVTQQETVEHGASRLP